MPDPIIRREHPSFSEMYTGGTITAIQTTVTVHVNQNPITIQTVWDIPEDEQMNAEEWAARKRTIGPSLVARASELTNLEYQVIQAVNAHIATLP
jgi:hypothetical protein